MDELMYVHIYISTCRCMFVRWYVCMYVCKVLCMYVCTMHVLHVCVFVCSNYQHKFVFCQWWHRHYCNWNRIVFPTSDISLRHYCISGCGLENTKLLAQKVRAVHLTVILLLECKIFSPHKSNKLLQSSQPLKTTESESSVENEF